MKYRGVVGKSEMRTCPQIGFGACNSFRMGKVSWFWGLTNFYGSICHQKAFLGAVVGLQFKPSLWHNNGGITRNNMTVHIVLAV